MLIFAGSMMLVPTVKTGVFPDTGQRPRRYHDRTADRYPSGNYPRSCFAHRQTVPRKYPEIDVLNFSEGQADTDNTFAQLSDNGSHHRNECRVKQRGDRERGLIEICDLMRKDLAQYSEIKEYKVLAGGSSGGRWRNDRRCGNLWFRLRKTDIVAAELARRLETLKVVRR